MITPTQVELLHRQYQEEGFIDLSVGELEYELNELRSLLQSAVELEHATIPPYLTGLYTLKPNVSWQIVEIIRTVVIEEMLHMILAANTLNAIGGSPTLTSPDFIADYPSYLPYKIDDLKIGLIGFSPEFVNQGLNIERPKYVDPVRVAKGLKERMTIGEFYVFIESKLRSLVRHYGHSAVFIGDPKKQIKPDMFYYGGANQPVVVHNLETAIRALEIITDQGEGIERSIWVDSQMSPKEFREVAHYFRFNELAQQRLYKEGDTYQSGPTGDEIIVPFSETYKIASNSKIEQYPEGSQVRKHAESFNKTYCKLLALIEKAFQGHPNLLLETVPIMYQLRDEAQRLIKNPFPGKESKDINAAPTFQYTEVN